MSDAPEVLIARIEKNKREHVRISLGTFKGRRHISVRIWFIGDDKIEKPSAKGANVPIDDLDDLVAAVLKARDAARDLGWLEEAAAA